MTIDGDDETTFLLGVPYWVSTHPGELLITMIIIAIVVLCLELVP